MSTITRLATTAVAVVAVAGTTAHVVQSDKTVGGGPDVAVENAASGELMWSDDFSGDRGAAPDPTRWDHQVGGKGWGNDEEQCYTDDRANSALNGRGQLVITARPAPEGFECAGGTENTMTSARLTTRGSLDFTYGIVEIRAKVPTGAGTWPAFWALPSDDDLSWPEAGEFDVLEHIARQPRTLHSTIHGADARGEHNAISLKTTLDEPVAERWHVYSVTWEKDLFTYRLDGDVIATISRDDAREADVSWNFDRDFHLILNLAMGGRWPGAVEDTSRPQQFLIDWVRVRAL